MPIPVQDTQAKQNQPTNNPQTPEPKVEPTPSTPQADPNTPAVTPPTTPSDDLISRASSVTLDPAQPKGDPNQGDIITDAGFDRNQWNDMLSKLPPEQKTQLEAAYKSLQTGADKKFQKAAEMLKEAQANTGQPWTVDRINELTQDPAFVQAAQQYAQLNSGSQAPQNSGLSDEEYSNLSDQEKAKFNELTKNQTVLQERLDDVLLAQQDEKLATRYKNYDANEVKSLRQGLIAGKVNATNEHLWKVLDYDDAVNRAYKLGLQDRQMEMAPKLDAIPVGGNGVNITPSGDAPVKAQGETTVSFFGRLAQYNKSRLAKAQGKQQ